MKSVRTWVVVADGTRALFLLNEGPGKGLAPARSELRGTKLPTRELGVERPGRVQESADTARHAVEPRTDPHRQEKQNFAHKVAAVLDEAVERNKLDRMVLIAPPKTLGDLRSAMHKNTAQRIHGELAKDLTHAKPAQLPEHLKNVIVL